MAKGSGFMTDLWSIALFAPLVMAARTQLIAMEAMRPTAKGRREISRMMREKPLAMAEAAFAAQKVFQVAGAGLAQGDAASSFALSADALEAATATTRRRVRRNARRLTGF